MEGLATKISQLDPERSNSKTMMKDDFYLTLPSHSSLQEFPQNANNNFKVRLPKLIRLTAGDCNVALTSISVPDPKNALPTPLHDDLTLFSYTSYYVQGTIRRIKSVFRPTSKYLILKNMWIYR